MKEIIPDVLAERYTSSTMVAIWSPKEKVKLMRRLWLAALRAQQELGMPIPPGTIEAYERVADSINLASIAKWELETQHDVKANIEEFNALAGGIEFIHLGFTSRDVTDNVEQLQIYRSLRLVRDRTVAILRRLGTHSIEYCFMDICGRSHNIPGQTTTLGKRFSNFAEEMLIAFDRLEHLIANYPLRGIKGPMGTQQDMVDLLGSKEKALEFEEKIRKYLGVPSVLNSVGQVYPRSLDFEVVSTLLQLSSAPGNFAKLIRLMAGHELAYEGFKESGSGSTAMPHKMNSRTCERTNGLVNILAGFLEMTRSLIGDQWYEGDVSCSVVRRIALPGAFFTIDGIYESTLTVLDAMKVFPKMIDQELQHYLPFLSTTRILMDAVKGGMSRERAHKIIKENAVFAVQEMRKGLPNTFVERLANDMNFPLDRSRIEKLLENPDHGLAPGQANLVCQKR